MMNKETIKYTAEALDHRIEKLGALLASRKQSQQKWKKELDENRSERESPTFSPQAEFDESTATLCYERETDWIKTNEPHYNAYVRAREAFRKEYGV